jgi:hypothetical protein
VVGVEELVQETHKEPEEREVAGEQVTRLAPELLILVVGVVVYGF